MVEGDCKIVVSEPHKTGKAQKKEKKTKIKKYLADTV